jgi:CrcB protein
MISYEFKTSFMLRSVLIVGLGGFIGTSLRFVIARYFQFHINSVFPWSTLLINILGSLLIGIIFGLSEKGDILSAEWRIFLTVGICGGFTTYSSFSNDSFILLQNKEFLRFAFYSGASFFLGILTVLVGRNLVKIL